jgi:hypothetical protein
MSSFNGKARLHPGGFNLFVYLNRLILRLSKDFNEDFKGSELIKEVITTGPSSIV